MIILSKNPKEQDRKYAAGEFVCESTGDSYAIGNYNWPKNRRVVLRNEEMAAIARFRPKRKGWLGFFSGYDRSVEHPETGEVLATWDHDMKISRSEWRVQGFLEIGGTKFSLFNRPKSPDLIQSDPFELTSTRDDFKLGIAKEFEAFDAVILLIAFDIHSEFWSLRYGGNS